MILSFHRLSEDDEMNNLDYVSQVICVGVAIATFLLNTGRGVKAIEVCKECFIFLNSVVSKKTEEQFVNLVSIAIYRTIFMAYCLTPDYTKAIKHGKQLLDIYHECGRTGKDEGILLLKLAMIYQKQFKYAEAGKLYTKAINIMREIGDWSWESVAYGNLGVVFSCLSEYDKAKEYLGKGLAITIETGDKAGQARHYGNLGAVFISLGEYHKAKEYIEKALSIKIDIGDKKGEAADLANLGDICLYRGEYDKAKQYTEKALAIAIETGDRKAEASCYGNLGNVFKSFGEYNKAKKYIEKALTIEIEIGDRKGEATGFANLAEIFQFRGEHDRAKEYLEKSLAIQIEVGDKAGEASCYANLGSVFHSLDEYSEAKKHLERALAIKIEVGERAGEASCYENLGTVFRSLGEYHKAKEYTDKALTIRIELGDRRGEATSLARLGSIFESRCEYDKAKEYLEKALAISIEIGDREEEASCYGHLGNVFQEVDEYERAKECYKKAMAIVSETGNRKQEAALYTGLGTMFVIRDEYEEAKENLDKALALAVEFDGRYGEASCYGHLGTLFHILGEYGKAKEYFNKGLAIRIETGQRAGQATDYLGLGGLFLSVGELAMGESNLEKALSISQDIGELGTEIECLSKLTIVKITQRKIEEAFDYLVLYLEKKERLHGFLRDNDQFKISFSDCRTFPYRFFSFFLVLEDIPDKALYVVELARARALTDLMATRYSVERQISADPQSWIGIENIMKQESNCSCLYISNFDEQIFLWILKTSGVMHFRTIMVGESDIPDEFSGSLNELFAESFRNFGIFPQKDCEDRSLHGMESKPYSPQEEELASLRKVKTEDDPDPRLTFFYNMIIAPVADLLQGSEIIIVPEPCLYHVPFPALLSEGGKYLSENFRIRIVPSLTTLTFIQDSPTDYHSQTGALVIGDPEVGRVCFNGRPKTFEPLLFARKEAEMIGRLLGVQPLMGEKATKQAVLQRLHLVSLIHFAAHGDAERGEIALSPVRSTNKLSKEEDYLLTMSDISKVQLRAKLVVLSCCHSGRGKVRAEEVIGIARAFLGSGARSVLVALWAIDDKATQQFMSRFYEHLVRGESASESLHEAMRWMRDNGWPEVTQWAPFMLIGDNVSFEFGK